MNVFVRSVISFERRCERYPFVGPAPLRDLGRLHFAYPTLRQGLYRWLDSMPAGRVLMPDYVPEGIYSPFACRGWRVAFYPVLPSLAIDREALRSMGGADIVVLVHHFGVYVRENVDAVREAVAGGIILEDFAHTVWDSRTVLTGDVCAFSFVKTLGVAEGSLLWVRERRLFRPCPYGAETPADRRLRRLLARRLLVEHLLATLCRPRLLHGVLLRSARVWCDYYSFLCKAYAELDAPIRPAVLRRLNRLDTDRIAAVRRDHAQRYVERLDSRLMFDLPRESFVRQALFGFPVRVTNREGFIRHMARHGVRVLVLTDRWWWQPYAPPNDVFRTHCLLPLSHYLSTREIDHVASAANRWRG